ncbi:MAG: hypothetical protein WC763_05655, partial [Candidatus Paceibacterota bacterium]
MVTFNNNVFFTSSVTFSAVVTFSQTVNINGGASMLGVIVIGSVDNPSTAIRRLRTPSRTPVSSRLATLRHAIPPRRANFTSTQSQSHTRLRLRYLHDRFRLDRLAHPPSIHLPSRLLTRLFPLLPPPPPP